ncbi:MAG: hypothetical protein CL678_14185 [Bdellovibrionaceae bacterium]|nr:hypothetical protein [Pseudobdellovibrionaceae bacterium]|tara:strand:+ start:2677 stop:3465 length:789 start_codon:yes stop_codon:yes gene_type:complete
MKHWMWAALKNGLQDSMAYRSEFLIKIFVDAAVPAIVQIILWYAIFDLGHQNTVAGYTYAQMMSYTLMTVLFTQVRGGDHDFELAEMIRTGELSPYLLKPLNVVDFIYIRGVAHRLFVSVICLCIGIGISVFTELSPLRLIGGMMLALLGNLIHYQIGAALASVSFSWEEGYALLMVKNRITMFLSGELIPLFLIPESYAWIWKSLPFYLYVFGPSQYALGNWSHHEFIIQFSIGIGWLIITSMLTRYTWRTGIRHYQGLGG